MAVRVQLRHDTAANWTTTNPVLAVGEVGVETDTTKHKIGDGVTAWAALGYALAEVNAARVGVRLAHDAVTADYLPVGFDKTTGTLYARKVTQLNGLYKTTDPNLQQWDYVTQFTSNSISTLGYVFVTAAGTLLALCDNGTNGYLFRSADAGVTWAAVASLSGSPFFATRRSFCQLANGAIFYGQYRTDAGPYTAGLYKSTDDGATFATVQTWANSGQTAAAPAIRHLHFALADPNVANRLWVGSGDQSQQCNLWYSDDSGATLTLVGGADQTWRSVDLIFTANALFWAMDGPDVAQYVYRYDRTAGTRTIVSRDLGNSGYYGGIDSGGRMWWGTVYETGQHQLQPEARIFTGKDDGQLWQLALRGRVKPTGTRKEWFPFGPGTDDAFYWGITDTTPAGPIYRLIRGHLMDEESTAPDLPTAMDSKRKVRRFSLYPGPDPTQMSTTSATIGANGRLWLQFFQPEDDFLATKAILKVVTQAGNDAWGIADGSGGPNANPGNVLAASASTAVPVAGAQSLTLPTPYALKAGVGYWFWLWGDTSTAAFGAVDHTVRASAQLSRFTDAFAAGVPVVGNAVGTASGTTRAWGAVIQ